MTHILLVESSPRGERSHTRTLARDLVERLRATHPDATLVMRDLAAMPALPHVSGSFVAAIFTPPPARSPDMQETLALSDALIDELAAADILVFATPMFNFTVGSNLKAWIDHVVRPGRTFWFQDGRYGGMLEGKTAYVVSASGGVYSEGPRGQEDFQIPYLRHILGFMGITDVRTIRAEGVAVNADAALTTARSAIERVEAV